MTIFEQKFPACDPALASVKPRMVYPSDIGLFFLWKVEKGLLSEYL